ncbi:MAG TPA: hypothetical protein VH166_08620 [Mycobacterium sp.]|nr:hypothetical protein [Mycobacterium sp.]
MDVTVSWGALMRVSMVAGLVGSGLIPRGGGAVAILIASMAIGVITATVALEQGRTTTAMFGWMITAFVVTFVVVSAAVHFLT